MLAVRGARIPSPPRYGSTGTSPVPAEERGFSLAARLGRGNRRRDYGSSHGAESARVLGTAQGTAPGAQPGGKARRVADLATSTRASTLSHFAGERGSKEDLREEKPGEERQREGREGSVALSPSPERRCVWQPRQPRSTFCCGGVFFSVIDPNYRSQPTRAECVTRVSRAAARRLKTQLPKCVQNEGRYHWQEPGVRAAGTAAVQHPRESPVRAETRAQPALPPRDPEHTPVLPHPPTLARCQEPPAAPVCLKLFHEFNAV